MSFKELLKLSGLTKRALGKTLKISDTSVYKWGGKAPGYAMAYIELLIKYKSLSHKYNRLLARLEKEFTQKSD